MAQVGNKNIDNASGQVVRLDIQNTFAAVTTNNFGARSAAGTILPCEFLADSDTDKLLIRASSGGDQANPSPPSGTAATFYEVGNLDEARSSAAAVSSPTRVVNGGGSVPSPSRNYMDYWEISTLGDAKDFGDLSYARFSHGSTSNAHGGL